MLGARVIPCLDVTAGRVVKGVNFVGLRDAGDPVELAARYDAEGADELVFLDITASSDARETMVDVVARVAEGEERERIWSRQKEVMPGFAEYEQKTSREIPVVVLERAG